MALGTLLRIALVVAAIGLVLLGALWIFQRHLIYLPDNSAVPPATTQLPGARDISLTTNDRLELGAWFVPATATPRGITVLIANGNGGNRADRAPLAAALRAEGFDVLLFDYRGYGGNPGTPTEAGLAHDVRAARAYLVDELGTPPARIIYFGESLGCGVVSELAVEHPPGALLLRSPFTDLAAAARAQLPLVPARLLLWDEFPVVENVRTIDVPTTVVLGERDSIVPPQQSRDVASASPHADIVEVPGANHNDDIMFDGREVVGAVVALSERM